MSQIMVSGLTFCHEGSLEAVFENVSFQIDTDWRLGFVGRNGRGKTTFLRILTGEYEYTGSIFANVSFEYFPYAVPDGGAETQQVMETVCPAAMLWEMERELSVLGMDEGVLCRPFNTLSNGEQTKALLAALFLKENQFLLIDEPTNHLDREARQLVSRYLCSKKGFILVSHDRAFLDGCTDHILSINKTDIEIQRGNFSSWLLNKERRDGFELAENEKLKKEVKRLSEAAKRTSHWSDNAEKAKHNTKNSGLRPDRGYIGHKAAKMMKQSQNIENRRQAAVAEKSKLLQNVETSQPLKLLQPKYHTTRFVLLDKTTLYYGGKAICKNVCFTIEEGDRIALRGRNGSGKSSIIRLIYGEDIQYTGQFQKGSRLRVSYIPQDTRGLQGYLSAYVARNGIDESLFKAILRKLDFSRAQLEKNMETFSAGQKKKVLLAKSLCEEAHLLIWDEPLNYIDLISRMQIEELLLACRPTILFVEHDAVFCETVATKQILLSEGLYTE